jgi:hypothetical protein
MATIALRGTETKKVVLKTTDGVQKVSCSCCGCAILPTTSVTLVISGASFCDDIFAPPPSPPNGSFDLPYVLTPYNPNLKLFFLATVDYFIGVSCENGVIDVSITSTGEGTFFEAPIELANGGSGTNTLVCGVSGAGYGGTATLSWE